MGILWFGGDFCFFKMDSTGPFDQHHGMVDGVAFQVLVELAHVGKDDGAGEVQAFKDGAYKKGVDAVCLADFHDFAVLFFADVSQFEHVAENGLFVGVREADQVVEGGGHAGGVGIVVVGDDGVASRGGDLRPVVGRDIVGDGAGGIFFADAEVLAYRNCTQDVAQVVVACEMRAEGDGVSADGEIRVHSRDTAVADAVRAVSVAYLFAVFTGAMGQELIAPVDEKRAFAGDDRIVQGPFGGDDVLHGAEASEMRLPDVGDHAVGGL